MNNDGIPSPGASWNRKGSGKGKRVDGKWQSTAIHGHAERGTGILNDPRYVGRIVWGRTRWNRSAADSSKRTAVQNPEPLHSYTDESQRIVPQKLWDAVKTRQARIHADSTTIRTVRRTQRGRPAQHLLSGLFTCKICGGSFRHGGHPPLRMHDPEDCRPETPEVLRRKAQKPGHRIEVTRAQGRI